VGEGGSEWAYHTYIYGGLGACPFLPPHAGDSESSVWQLDSCIRVVAYFCRIQLAIYCKSSTLENWCHSRRRTYILLDQLCLHHLLCSGGYLEDHCIHTTSKLTVL